MPLLVVMQELGAIHFGITGPTPTPKANLVIANGAHLGSGRQVYCKSGTITARWVTQHTMATNPTWHRTAQWQAANMKSCDTTEANVAINIPKAANVAFNNTNPANMALNGTKAANVAFNDNVAANVAFNNRKAANVACNNTSGRE